MLNIINKTIEILKANSEWQERYEEYLSDIWSNPNKTDKGFKKPQGLSVYTRVGDRNTKTTIFVSKDRTLAK